MTDCPHIRPRSKRSFWVPFISVALLARAPRAQQVEISASQALFEEARQLMLDDRVREACPKFAESLRLDPALGTLLNLALCHEKQGKFATAYLEYTDAVARSAREGDGDRRVHAEKRLARLEPRVIRLTLDVRFAAPPGFWIRLDGTRLGTAALGVAVPVDAGAHIVHYGAPGMRSKTIELSVDELDLRPALALSELEAATAPDPLPDRAATSASGDLNTRYLAMGFVFGGSVAMLALGTFAGIKAGSEWSKRNEHCQAACDEVAGTYGDSAQRFARLSDVGFGMGLALAGAGFYLLASSPRDKSGAGLNLSGRPGSAMVFLGGDL